MNTTDVPHHDNEGTLVRRFLEPGLEIVSGVSGAAVGALIGGPPGLVLGAATPTVVTRVLQRGLGEVMQRELSNREQARIGGVLLVAAEQITQRQQRGEQPRQDGFFTPLYGQRPDSDEIAEGVLRAAQREHEERKVPYLGYLISSISFDPDISRADANALLRQVDSLTYRQLVLLALIERTERGHPDPLDRPSHRVEWQNLRRSADTSFTAQTMLDELEDLERRGLIAVAHGLVASFGSSVTLTGAGRQLHTLLELERVDHRELDELDETIHLDCTAPPQDT